MPRWTLGTLMSETTAMIGNRSDLALSRASFLANVAAEEVWYALPHADQEAIAVSSTTSGENRIVLPTDFEEVINVSNVSFDPPRDMRQVHVNDIDTESTEIGEPELYAQYNDWLELWPSPDSSYSLQLRYRVKPSVLTQTTDVPSFATRLGYAWLLKTAELYADALLDVEQAATWREKYIAYMAGIPSDLALRQRARSGMQASMLRWRKGKRRELDFDRSDS